MGTTLLAIPKSIILGMPIHTILLAGKNNQKHGKTTMQSFSLVSQGTFSVTFVTPMITVKALHANSAPTSVSLREVQWKLSAPVAGVPPVRTKMNARVVDVRL